MNDPQALLINGTDAPPSPDERLVRPVTATLMSSNGYVTRKQLDDYSAPPGTASHRILPHPQVISALYDTLGLRKLGVTRDQYAISKDGMECYWTFDLDAGFPGGNFTLAGRNSHSKKFALGIAIGYRVKVCDNGMFPGDAVTRKHTSKISLEDYLSVGVDHIIRNFEPLAKNIERWREEQLSVQEAKLCIYEAFIEQKMDLARHLMSDVHDLYFNPTHEEFQPGSVWSLQNAYTGAIKSLDPIPQQRAQASIGEYFRDKKF